MKKYVIINANEVSSIDFNKVLETKGERKSKSFKTYEEAKAFLDSKQYDKNGCEI